MKEEKNQIIDYGQEEKDPKIIINLKKWFKNLKKWFKSLSKNKKIILAVALTGVTTGTTGLITGAVIAYNLSGLKYYLKSDNSAVLGVGTIWTTNPKDTLEKDYKFFLYFADKPVKRQFKLKPDSYYDEYYTSTDIKWNGKYPDWYFDKKTKSLN